MPEKKDSMVHALARQGGIARARILTPEERRESAKKAANARWERYREERGTVIAECAADGVRVQIVDGSFNNVEMEAFKDVMERVHSHRVSATCSCDDCVDAVVAQIRKRYLTVLAKIDAAEPLDKDEGLLFRMLTGEKANRWTRIYRQERKDITRATGDVPEIRFPKS
jgi:hypothetical protein